MKLQMGIILLSMMILGACSQGTSNADNTPAPQNKTQDNTNSPNSSSTTATDAPKSSVETVLLNDGSKLVISETSDVAVLQVKDIHYKLRIGLITANWSFLPYPRDLKKSCDQFRDDVKSTLQLGSPRTESAYSYIFNMEAAYFTLERNLKPQLEMANQALLSKGLKKTVVLKIMNMTATKIQSPSIMLSGTTIPRDLGTVLGVISKYQNGHNSFALTIGELCDITAPESIFTDEEQYTNITFELLK